MKIVDCRGMPREASVGATRTALEEMEFPLEIRLDHPDSQADVSQILGGSGYRYQTIIDDQGKARIIVTGKRRQLRQEKSRPVWLITSSTLGRGEPELGRALMKSLLHTLSELSNPGTIYFLNSGVKLCAGPDALEEYLKPLEQKDWQLLCCGTCLDYYVLRDEIRAGTVTNMSAIIQGLQGAEKVTSI